MKTEAQQINDLQLILYNVEGRKIRRIFPAGQGFHVNRDDLAPGIYYWQITYMNGEIHAFGKIVFIN